MRDKAITSWKDIVLPGIFLLMIVGGIATFVILHEPKPKKPFPVKEMLHSAREGTVEIIADGVERGIKRTLNDVKDKVKEKLSKPEE